MSRHVLDVFLSSTSQDLGPHRAKVREMIERLEQASIGMETFGARPETPIATCRQRVQAADALVVLVGHRYGWIPGAADDGDGEKSITWWEVTWALEAGKPVYAYLVDERAPWTGEKEQDRLRDPQDDVTAVVRAVRSLQQFRTFLEGKTTRDLFTSADDLAGKVATSLANWIRDQQLKGAARTSGAPAQTPPPPSWPGSPFPGLRAFTPLDAPIFFGRERETDFLVSKLACSECRFLLVVGASGSGKSSLVAAGLIPRLAEGALPASDTWLLPQAQKTSGGPTWVGLRFTPGELGPDPFIALAVRLAPIAAVNVAPASLAQQLHDAPERLPDMVSRALDNHARDQADTVRAQRAEAVLFVDQFEELVTRVAEDDRRARFVRALAACAASSRIRILATVRADFLHRAIEAQPELAELLRDRGVTVPLAVPGAGALARMIEGPAARAGLTFDEGLVQTLVDETTSRAGGLALVAFALQQLFDARSDGRLSVKAYEAFGGLAGAINTHAEATFAQLAPAVQQHLARVFGQLVVVEEHGIATRRRTSRHEVVGSSPDAALLVAAFVDARLLVSDSGPDGAPVLEVAHEALLREWPRLAGWIRERADDLRLLQQVEDAAREWDRCDRAAHFRWPHERLVPAHDALRRLGRRDDLDEPTRTFVRCEWEWLMEELQDIRTTHQRRAAIGDRLDQLGDPRPGVGVIADGTPDIAWCEIPGGFVEVEGIGAFDVAPFRLAKYPVTWRQYKAFLDAPDGYRQQEHWKGLAPWREPGDQRALTSNCPADNVSWYDAMAFCRWLAARLQADIRLPRECEWQQAACGGRPECLFPWGAEPDAGRANTRESKLARSTAVGMYPHGASAHGVMDLAGTVCEWCLETRDPAAADDAPRVARGGAWSYGLDTSRAAYRRGGNPGFRNDNYGLRVVWASRGYPAEFKPR